MPRKKKMDNANQMRKEEADAVSEEVMSREVMSLREPSSTTAISTRRGVCDSLSGFLAHFRQAPGNVYQPGSLVDCANSALSDAQVDTDIEAMIVWHSCVPASRAS